MGVDVGRHHINANAHELVNDFVSQVRVLSGFTALHGVKLQHVNLHRPPYMHAAKSESLSLALISALQQIDANLFLYCMASSITTRVAKAMEQPMMLEFYAGREYDQSGSTVFTRHVGLLDAEAVSAKVVSAQSKGHRVSFEEAKSVFYDKFAVESCIRSFQTEARKNPYASKLKHPVTMRLPEDVVEYFKGMAVEAGVPDQSLINLHLRDCLAKNRKVKIDWPKAA